MIYLVDIKICLLLKILNSWQLRFFLFLRQNCVISYVRWFSRQKDTRVLPFLCFLLIEVGKSARFFLSIPLTLHTQLVSLFVFYGNFFFRQSQSIQSSVLPDYRTIYRITTAVFLSLSLAFVCLIGRSLAHSFGLSFPLRANDNLLLFSWSKKTHLSDTHAWIFFSRFACRWKSI